MKTAYKIPMPFKLLAGNQPGRWIPSQTGYPLVPGTEIRELMYYDGSQNIMIPHFFGYDPIGKPGEWTRQAAWIGGEWIECFKACNSKIFGKSIVTYAGLRPDVTLGDFMCWFPEVSFSIQ